MEDRRDYTIYKWIHSTLPLDFRYVGSTSDMKQRKKQHKSDCHNENSKNHNAQIYKIMREYGFENFIMVPIEIVKNITKTEARIIEENYRMDLEANMNMRRCFTSEEEYEKNRKKWKHNFYVRHKEDILIRHKEYNEANKEKIAIRCKEYANNHKEEILKWQGTVCDCECGKSYTKSNKARHEKCQTHLMYLLELEKTPEYQLASCLQELQVE
jgi:predicted GIY-YIG superfamily endonuclease